MSDQVSALKQPPALHKRKLTLHDNRVAPIGMEIGTAPQKQHQSTRVQMPVKTMLAQERPDSATKTERVAHTSAVHHAAVDAANVTGLGDGLRKFPHALLNHYQQHGVLGSFYRSSKNKFAVQPTILLGMALVCFIGVQVAALVYVGIHAHNSMKVLEAAREQRPDRKGGLRELIPGISWADCVPYETRPRSNSGHLNQRRAKDGGVPVDEQYVGPVAREGMSSWRCKQRSPYGATSGADASLQKLQRSTRPQEDLTPRGERAWDSLENTLAVATRQADKNKRIMDLLHQTTKPDSLSVMLDHEYEAMVQWDVENNLPGQAKREHISPTLAPFTC